MPLRYVRQLFTGGWNADIDPAAIDLMSGGGQDANSSGVMVVNQVTGVGNMVFERGLIVSRPPEVSAVTTGTSFAANTTIVGAVSLPIGILNSTNPPAEGQVMILGVDTSGTYSVYSGFLTTPPSFPMSIVAPTGPSLGGIYPIGGVIPASFSAAVVNQAIIIGGFNNGLYHWNPPNATYTVVSTQLGSAASWLYVAKLYSRAIGAFALGGSGGPINPITIGASAAGDETDWTSVNAYQTVLSDVPDEITGLGVIKGTVVVPRRYGFHLGAATGQSPAIFTWSAYSDNDIGCLPGSFQTYKNIGFFISDVGVHMFDLVNITDIGEGVYTQISGFISNGANIQTWISYAYRLDFQPCYNIFLSTSGVINNHFMFNIKEQKWSFHSYEVSGSTPPLIGLPLRLFNTTSGSGGSLNYSPISAIGFLEQPTTAGRATLLTVRGGNGVSAEGTLVEGCGFVSPQITLQPSYEDTFLTRIMLTVYVGNITNVPTVFVTSLLNNNSQSTQFITSDTILNPGWNFLWFNARAAGQNFQIQVFFTNPVSPVKCKEMWYEFTTSGKQRN